MEGLGRMVFGAVVGIDLVVNFSSICLIQLFTSIKHRV